MRRGLGLLAFVLGLGCGASLASCGGSSGSNISITAVGDTCEVDMHQNAEGFEVSMVLDCAAGAVDCFTITSLTCDGVNKSEAVPIDLTGTGDDCPDARYCITDCNEGLEDGSGNLWDTPSLRAVEGCDVYEAVPESAQSDG